MGFDRDQDWAPRQKVFDIGTIQRAALSASYVTGDEHWDAFLEMVNASLVSRRDGMDQAVEALKGSNDFSPESLIRQKLAVRQLGCEIEALEWVIGLPKLIMEKSDKAKELLGTVDETSH